MNFAHQGWPDCKTDVTEAFHAYYNFRDELTVQDQLVFKGGVVVIPAALHKEMMAICHDTHIGVEVTHIGVEVAFGGQGSLCSGHV